MLYWQGRSGFIPSAAPLYPNFGQVPLPPPDSPPPPKTTILGSWFVELPQLRANCKLHDRLETVFTLGGTRERIKQESPKDCFDGISHYLFGVWSSRGLSVVNVLKHDSLLRLCFVLFYLGFGCYLCRFRLSLSLVRTRV